MQAILESIEHVKNAEAHIARAKEIDPALMGEDDLAFIEADLAIAKAVAGLALAILVDKAAGSSGKVE